MMDKRTLAIVLVCMLALFGLQTIVNKIYPPIPKKAKPAQPVVTNVIEAVKPAPPAIEKPAPSVPETIVVLSNQLISVEFTSWGGGIRSVELLQHRADGHGHELAM